MTLSFTPIPESDPAVVASLNRSATCGAIDAADFPGWEKVLSDPARDPSNYMRVQGQSWSDCQAQATANGAEKREGYVKKGKTRQRSDSYAYAACEYIDQGRVGANHGTTITAGVILQTKGIAKLSIGPGLPLEADWPYRRRTNTKEFIADAKRVNLEQSYISEQQPVPDFETTLIAMAAGGSAHIGTLWSGIRWKTLGKKREMTSKGRSGGHATEGVWGEKINGAWYLKVWNSHGDAFYYVGEAMWNRLVDMKFSPFGGWLLMPEKAQERYSLADWKSKLRK